MKTNGTSPALQVIAGIIDTTQNPAELATMEALFNKEADRLAQGEKIETWTNYLEAFRALMETNGKAAGYTGSWIITVGTKWAKIARHTMPNGGESVEAFVCRETGNIHKPASWKVPAKHARGNIYAEDGGASAIYPATHIYGGMVRSLR